jgi:catechol 2,3-dioxygenase
MALPDDAHIEGVSLTVRDLDRSIAFYRDVLGFTVKAQTAAEASLSAGGERILVELHERADAVPRPRRCTGLYHFAILVPARAALGRSLRRLDEQDWPLTGVADHLVSEALYLSDPDGLGIEIYRDRPRETWQRVGGQIAMASDPLDVQSVANEPGAEQPWTGLDPATVIGHVHLHVASLERAEQVYCGVVGFEPMVRTYPGALFVAAGGYHHHLGLNTWLGEGAPPPPENAVGLRSFSIRARELEAGEVVDESSRVVVDFAADQQPQI